MSHRIVTFVLPGYNLHTFSALGSQSTSSDKDLFVSRSAFIFTEDHTHEPWQSHLATAFGLRTHDGRQLPIAKLLGLPKQAPDQHGLDNATNIARADPVFLKADKDSARVVPAEQMALTDEDADALLLSLNEFVSMDGLEFCRRGTTEWYIKGMCADSLESYPPSFLANRNVSSFLPDGDAMVQWRRLLTELQMLLHTHPVNQQRESKGLMPVNSVWFWGGGKLPAVPLTKPDVAVYADDVQAIEMARFFNVSCRPLSSLNSSAMDQMTAEHTVIIDNTLVEAWLSANVGLLEQNLERINNEWLGSCADRVESAILSEVNIRTEDGLHGMCNAHTIRTQAKSKAKPWYGLLGRLFKR